MPSSYLSGVNLGIIQVPDNTTKAFLIRVVIKHKWIVILSIAVTLLTSIAVVYPNEFLRMSINAISVADTNRIWRNGLLYFIVLLFSLMCNQMKDYVNLYLQQSLSRNLQKESFAHLMALPYLKYRQYDSADILTREMSAIEATSSIIVTLISNLEMLVLSASWSLILAFRIDPLITLLVAVFIEPIGLVITRFAAPRLRAYAHREQELGAKVWQVVLSTLVGIREVRLYTAEKARLALFCAYLSDHLRIRSKSWTLERISISLTTILDNCIRFAVVTYSGYRAIKGEIGVGDIVALITYLGMFQGRANILIGSFSKLQANLAKLDRSLEILSVPEEGNEAVDHQLASPAIPSKTPEECSALSISNLKFAYSESSGSFVLGPLDLCCRRGEVIGIVGPSGSGKTTLISLLTGLNEVFEGTILLGGRDIRHYPRQELRTIVGVLPQEPILFDLSVRDNIRFGYPSASDSAVIEAAKVAYAHNFIIKLERGYDTLVGENGTSLSVGQKQRIALARLVLRDPQIVILDEPTTSLDTKSQAAIIAAMSRVLAGKTAIIISHQFPILRLANRIYVFQDGVVLDAGSYATLLESCPLYQRLWQLQFSEEEMCSDASQDFD